jgi:2-haloacid dehalogenase
MRDRRSRSCVPRSVDAVFFDLYGTLVDLAGLEWACAVAVGDRGAELAARWRERQLEATWLRTAMDRWADFAEVTEAALRLAAGDLGLELDPVAVDRTLLPAWSILPPRIGIDGLLDRLERGGIPTGVLTNGSTWMLERTLDGAGLDDRFRWRLSVDAVRRYKPAREVYGLAISASGVAAERIGFVTANGWDAAGAAACGFRVAWLRDGTRGLPAVGPLDPAPAAITLDEVASLFGA